MDIIKSIKIIHQRFCQDLQKYNIDVGRAVKIFRCLLLFCTPEQLTEFASASEVQFDATIIQVGHQLNSSLSKHNAASHMPSNHSPRYIASTSSFQVPARQPHLTSNEFLGNPHFQLDLPISSSNIHYSDAQLVGGLDSRGRMRSSSGNSIYLSFLAECTFTEEDVLNYFEQFGPVLNVRFPRQVLRTFGFVNFKYPETVLTILGRRNPHFICGQTV